MKTFWESIYHSLGFLLRFPCLFDLGRCRPIAKDEGRGALVGACCLGHIIVGKEDRYVSCQCNYEVCDEEEDRKRMEGICVVGKEGRYGRRCG